MYKLVWSPTTRVGVFLLIVCFVATFIALVSGRAAEASGFPISFSGSPQTGDGPNGITQASDGNFYGTTSSGGAASSGTFFRVTPSGTLATLYSFTGLDDGQYPVGTLVQDPADGNFYGVTEGAGVNGGGTVFQITPSGFLTTIFAFSFNDHVYGCRPSAGLALGYDGSLYGTNNVCGPGGWGTVFKISNPTTAPAIVVIHAFSNGVDGSQPGTPLVLGRDGGMYGTTIGSQSIDQKASTSSGTIYQITPAGTFSTLCSFPADGSEGEYPWGLIQGVGSDTSFYGVTYQGGSLVASASVFKMSVDHTLSTLYTFPNYPVLTTGGLAIGQDGKLYGTTRQGIDAANGTIFDITTSGTNVVTVHAFTGADGQSPNGPIVCAKDGYLYGTTSSGGSNHCGAVFRQAPPPPDPPTGLEVVAGNERLNLNWSVVTGATGYKVYRSAPNAGLGTETLLASPSGTATAFVDTSVLNGKTYRYEVTALDLGGESAKSNEAVATPVVPVVSFVETDIRTRGFWKNFYGEDGWFVLADPSANNPSIPSYATVTPYDDHSGVWTQSSPLASCLLCAAPGSTTHVAGVWYNTSFGVNVDIVGTHEVALYFLDYGNEGFAETITVTDAVTGAVLDREQASNFRLGQYKVWKVNGDVDFNFASTKGYWAVVSGLFFGQ